MTLVVQTQGTDTADGDEPLLSYTVSTTPSPLKASPENPQAPEEIGEVIITVARQSGTPADVEWIRVKVPAGTMAPDLATDLNKITPRITLTGWTAHLDEAAKEFVFSPRGSHEPIGPDTGFTIQLSDIPMSRKVGTAPVTVTESSREGNAAFKDKKTVFNLGKFPADFYLRNFLSTPPSIPNGGDVKLTWERSANATYELLYGDVNRDVTNRTSLDIEGIKSDTTFYLRGTTGDPTNPVVRMLWTRVSVIKPDLEIGNLTVNGSVIAKGNVTIEPGNHLAVPKIISDIGRIEVASSIRQTSGDITLDNGGLTVNGPAAITGGLTATTVTARDTLFVGLPTASALPDGNGNNTPDKMLDGLDDTYYESRLLPYVDDWAMVDVGGIVRMTRIEIRFGERSLIGVVETSPDQISWTSRGNVTHPVCSITLPNGGVEARYARVRVTEKRDLRFEIRQFLVTPGMAFTAGRGPSGTLGSDQLAASAGDTATKDGGQPA
ncbi:discoidin domain-containing protein [Streptomyces goshikiensis]|uniref:discoidin domain-containing protein n=1 Tax=Streptomyces goshikiensis TaxID=1942 RepID=UPI0036840434